ncbi:hypothetical protein SteCoe_23546 [Stentor coeruleus]|uniref:Uncharacterized protein n=1 Tax=Stentor coeruleus TaxID=5963 RepID=A0A1R2BJQ2_9CILI|nr:hypothetical protein SteCoe_23546 [Stentor coeruleus]
MEVREIPLGDTFLYLQVLKLSECGYIYIGDTLQRMDNMTLVLPSKYDPLPSIVPICGNIPEITKFMQKLCRQFGMLAFSINCSISLEMLPLLETEIAKIMSN